MRIDIARVPAVSDDARVVIQDGDRDAGGAGARNVVRPPLHTSARDLSHRVQSYQAKQLGWVASTPAVLHDARVIVQDGTTSVCLEKLQLPNKSFEGRIPAIPDHTRVVVQDGDRDAGGADAGHMAQAALAHQRPRLEAAADCLHHEHTALALFPQDCRAEV